MKPTSKSRQNRRNAATEEASPLAQLRHALKKTQAQFAEVIGASASYLEKMERGKKPVPDSTANLLMMLYGVDPKSVKTRAGKLKHLLGAYRLRERIEEWEQSLPIAEVDTALMLNQRVLPKLDVLHQAAANEQRALHLLALLDESITAIVSTLRLGSAIDSELALRVQAGDAVDWEPVLRAGTETKAHLLDVDVDVLYEVSVAESTAAILDPDNHIGTPKEERGMSQVNPDKMKRLVRLQKGG